MSFLESILTYVRLQTFFVPEDLRCPRSGENQSFSDWTYIALSERPTRKIKANALVRQRSIFHRRYGRRPGSTFIAAFVASPQMARGRTTFTLGTQTSFSSI